MTQSAVLPSCPGCGTLRTPGAPMCLQCWLPFDEPAPHTAAPQPVVPLQSPPVGNGAPAALPPGWRPPASVLPAGAPTRPGSSRRSSRRGSGRIATRSSTIALRLVVSVVVLALVAAGVGGYLWYRHGRQSTPQRIAAAFHRADRLTLVPGVSVIPEIDAGPNAVDTPPAAFVASIDPAIRAVDTDITSLQQLLDSWARGHATAHQVQSALSGFGHDLAPLDAITEQAPQSLFSMAKQVQTAATGYALATSGLAAWLTSGADSSRSRYFLTVGNSAADWRDGVTALYQGAGLPVPALPTFEH